jgi:hypothetical protein
MMLSNLSRDLFFSCCKEVLFLLMQFQISSLSLAMVLQVNINMHQSAQSCHVKRVVNVHVQRKKTIRDVTALSLEWSYNATTDQLSPRPSLSRALGPCSNHSSREIQNSCLFFMMSANTAPPKKTMCFRRGGSSILILNFCIKDTSERY